MRFIRRYRGQEIVFNTGRKYPKTSVSFQVAVLLLLNTKVFIKNGYAYICKVDSFLKLIKLHTTFVQQARTTNTIKTK